MATSQNGYEVRTSSSGLDKSPLTGTDITLPNGVRDDATGFVLRYVAAQFHKRVEPLHAGWNWGYAYRAIRGQTSGYSNHASGTAIDLNAPKHPLGRRNTFSAAQVREIREILAEVDGVVRWGGDYSRPDEMHFEINASYAKVSAVVVKLKRPAAKPTTATSKYTKWQELNAGYRSVKLWDSGEDVKKLQYILNRWYGNLNLTEDGYFGKGTEDAVKYMQTRSKLTADGVVGPRTWAVLNVT